VRTSTKPSTAVQASLVYGSMQALPSVGACVLAVAVLDML
jgi:hypothetical protein